TQRLVRGKEERVLDMRERNRSAYSSRENILVRILPKPALAISSGLKKRIIVTVRNDAVELAGPACCRLVDDAATSSSVLGWQSVGLYRHLVNGIGRKSDSCPRVPDHRDIEA